MVTYRDGTLADIPAIDAAFRASFTETFAHLYRPKDLDDFYSQFTPEAWAEEMNGADYAFRLAEADGQLAGFLKLGPLTVPVEARPDALELRQLYVLQPWQGTGIAEELMAWGLDEARRRGIRDLYLTVYVENHRARRFYERYGFEMVGPCAFMVGEHEDEDWIMKLRL